MSNPLVREVGRVQDIDGSPVVLGVDEDSVTIGHGTGWQWCLTRAQAEEFAQAFVAACWEAGRNASAMAQAASDG